MPRDLDAFDADAFWAEPADAALRALGSSPRGLGEEDAAERLAARPAPHHRSRAAAALAAFVRQVKNPIVLLLLFAAALSFALEDRADAAIVIGIVLASSALGAFQEHRAGDAIARLSALVASRATVVRDGAEREIAIDGVVPGDIVVLRAGSSVPGDGVLLEARDLFVDESTLTGESFPVEKRVGTSPRGAPISAREGAVFAGTHVGSGLGRMLVVHTGPATEVGRLARRLAVRPPETELEHKLRLFGVLLLELTLVITLLVFAANVWFHRPVLDSMLFALALAVGLTPQLLPAVTAVNLARGAQVMARSHVVVKRLSAIQDYGSMTVLCSDKTGTLTEGVIRVRSAVDARGAPSDDALALARVNAALQCGYDNPIDRALVAGWQPDPAIERVDEIPYDFVRRRVSVLAREGGRLRLVTKGAVESVLAICASARTADGARVALDGDAVRRLASRLAEQGLRVVAVAERDLASAPEPLAAEAEAGMTFAGLLALEDAPREGAAAAKRALEDLGVRLVVVTGDHRAAARHVAEAVGIAHPRVLTGADLQRIGDAALPVRAARTDVFAEVEPTQKERIVLALRKAGMVVGYVGDGINDAAALHAADVGISVANATDVARDAADLVLLEPGLDVLQRGVLEGRKVFANTMKYVLFAASANLGNMMSMAGASLLLPFLPLLPKQLLFLNVLTDLPEMTIASDRVDEEWTARPQRWDIRFVRAFMLAFGALSSVFDFFTFAVLLRIGNASEGVFRTGWFVESVASAATVVLVIRTRRPFVKSAPSRALAGATAGVVLAAIAIPYTPVAAWLGFVPLPPGLLALLLAIVAAYALAAEIAKRSFYRSHEPGEEAPARRATAVRAHPGRHRDRPGHARVTARDAEVGAGVAARAERR